MKKLPISVLGLVGLMFASFSGVNIREEVPTRAEDLAERIRANDGDYVLVKSASDLKSGSKVIIAAGAYNYAMSATQGSSNRGQVAITKSVNSNGYNIATWTGNVGQFTLGKGTTSSTYSFYDNGNKGYLYAASNSSNYLKTQASLTTNSSWNITIASNGYATVKANGSYKRNWMRYNSSSKLFSCYSSGQKDIAIYQQQEAAPATVAVTGVSLDKTSVSLDIGGTVTLNATVSPTNATNKGVNWSSSNAAVASVAGGVVTAKAAGTATITATTQDGNKTASCVVTVKAPAPVVEPEEGSFNVLNTNLPTAYSSGVVAVGNYDFSVVNVRNYGGNMQFKKSGYILNNDPIEGLKTIQLNSASGKSFSGTLYVGTEPASTELSAAAKNNNAFSIPEGYDYFALQCGSSTGYLKSITITYAKGGEVIVEDIYPTGIAFEGSSATLNVGGSKQLNVSYAPANANAGLDVSFASSNTAVATVSSTGLVTAKAAGNATITATSTYNSNLKATFAITVNANPVVNDKDAWTIMIYMSGNDLESGNSYHLATMDITEILSVANQPDDVNIIIETGGAKSWASTYGVSASYLQRWHVENKKLVKDANVTKANMGQASTFQSFLEWGLTEYPAEKTGVIMWNHGGAMRGVCYDENYNNDCLLNNEVNQALSGAFAATGRTEKLEFIGYDACLMAVQDIAEFNSNYFNYMVCSEESEAGYGWDYDTFVDDIYAKRSTQAILKAIVDGFIADNGGVSSSQNDQTLSYLNLSYMPAYKSAWENMAAALKNKVTSSNKSSFKNLVTQCKHYADSDYIYYGIFDAKDFVTRLGNNSTFNPGTTYTNSVLNAFANLVEYSSCGRGAGNSNGLAMFYSVNSYCQQSTYYSASQTNFANWRTLNSSFGY